MTEHPFSHRYCKDRHAFDALLESIEHWNNLWLGTEKLAGAPQCALCRRYSNESGLDCDGCPVAVQTREGGCVGTPWVHVTRHDADHEEYVVKSAAGALEMYQYLVAILLEETIDNEDWWV